MTFKPISYYYLSKLHVQRQVNRQLTLRFTSAQYLNYGDNECRKARHVRGLKSWYIGYIDLDMTPAAFLISQMITILLHRDRAIAITRKRDISKRCKQRFAFSMRTCDFRSYVKFLALHSSTRNFKQLIMSVRSSNMPSLVEICILMSARHLFEKYAFVTFC